MAASAAALKAQIKSIRADMQGALDQYPHAMPDSVAANIDSWNVQLDSLVAQFTAAKANEERAAAERERVEAIFSGQGSNVPTGDGSRPYGAAPTSPTFASAFLDAGFNPQAGRTAVTVNLAEAFIPQLRADLTVSGAGTPGNVSVRPVGNIAALGRDQRWLWPHLPTQGIGDATSVSDFTQTGSRTITGSVERAVAATTDKAILDVTLSAVTEDVVTLAVLIEDIPVQILRSLAGIEQFLNSEARFAVEQTLDAHVLAQIVAATPPFGNAGAGLPEQIRTAIGAERLLGSMPNLLALSPTDSVTLDLLTDNEARYYGGNPFNGTGMTSTLWGLEVVETPTVTDPLLIDTARIGILYLGQARVDLDMFTGFRQNLVTMRLELNALMHVRIPSAAYRVAAA